MMRKLLFALVVMMLVGVACAGAPASGRLTVEEHAVVAQGEDTPDHIEYLDRLGATVLDVRREWREPEAEQLVASTNQALDRFGYQLVSQEKEGWAYPFYDLYHGDTLVLADLMTVWPIAVNGTQSDFALLVEPLNALPVLVRRGGVEEWDPSLHAAIPPVFVDDDLVAVETDARAVEFRVKRGDETVYNFSVPAPEVGNPAKGLWSWMGHWVFEVDGQVVVDGRSLNQELGYDEIFGWRLLKGQPFYFFRKGEAIGVSYAGQVLQYQYDEVIHYQCCEGSVFNVAGNETMVWFHARRDGMWYYVEMGVYK